MDSIPLQLRTDGTILRNWSVPSGLHPPYIKWLRFYLNFCQKYRFPDTERKSLDHFLQKLHEKKQTDVQQQQSLSTDHVKAFLIFLAVTKKVSASTQNQAFNALLLF